MASVVVEEGGQTLAGIVRGALSLPWSKAKALCSSGRVYVDGEAARDPALRVEVGATVEVDPTAPRERTGVLPKEAVVYEDTDILVVTKPAGTLTVPYREEKDTLSDQARAYLRRGGRRNRRDPMIGVVQRLDKSTTGVLVFARTMKAKRALEDQLRAHTVHRRYLAIVHGAARSARYESSILQDRGDGLRGSWGTQPKHHGRPPKSAKPSVTHVSMRENLRGATLLECRLETGRQHQIRIHLAEAGHPLVGERVYIRDYRHERIEAPRPMLHAVELGFDHPRTGEAVRFRVELPEDFEAMRSLLRAPARG